VVVVVVVRITSVVKRVRGDVRPEAARKESAPATRKCRRNMSSS